MVDQVLKVSIIMPTYNRSHCIRIAITSLQTQTYPHWELIVSDNHGDNYRFRDSRIIVIDSREVAGAAYRATRPSRMRPATWSVSSMTTTS